MFWKNVLVWSLSLLSIHVLAQATSGNSWNPHQQSFEPVAITATRQMFWVCGAHEGIASSPDGAVWTTHHSNPSAASPTLLGISFQSEHFGYAYGTGGALLTTTDGGSTWNEIRLGNDAILQASFADPVHGLFRTALSLFYIDGGAPKQLPLPPNLPSDFKQTSDPVALTPERMSIQLSEGWRSRAGFVSTNDGGKSWSFYEPPHMQPNGQLAIDGSYWAYGTETVGYDAKGGGGLGVPLLMHSDNAHDWTRTSADVHVCHWEGCDLCRIAGCLASSDRLVNAYGSVASNKTFPHGHLTAEWSAVGEVICTVDGNVFCSSLKDFAFVDKPEGVEPVPSAQQSPPLGTKPASGLLRCVRCSLDPVFVDQAVSGVFTVKIGLTVAADGIPQNVVVEEVPSDAIRSRIQKQVESWLFEPILKDDKPVNVKTSIQTKIQVLKSR